MSAPGDFASLIEMQQKDPDRFIQKSKDAGFPLPKASKEDLQKNKKVKPKPTPRTPQPAIDPSSQQQLGKLGK